MGTDKSVARAEGDSSPEQRIAHFVVHGEDLTRIGRQMWADEREPARALRLLLDGLQGIDLQQAIDVLTGKAKLTGSNSRVRLVRDDADTSPCGQPFPSLIEAFDHERKRSEMAERDSRDAVVLLAHDTVMMASPGGRREVSMETAHELERGRITWEDVRVFRDCSYMEVARARQDETGGPPPPLQEAPVDDPWQQPPSEEPPPESYPAITQDTGWLSPEGRFYPCSYYEHDSIAHRLGKSRWDLDRLGWVVLAGSEGIHRGNIEVTQAQRDLVFDWCTSRKQELPYWMRPEWSDD